MQVGGRELNTKAVAAGGGFGTLLVALAGQIAPSNQVLATVLTYAAPGISVGAAGAWVVVADLLATRVKRYRVDQALKRARAHRDVICNDPHASATHKAATRTAVEHFETLGMAVIQSEFETIDVKLESFYGPRAQGAPGPAQPHTPGLSAA